MGTRWNYTLSSNEPLCVCASGRQEILMQRKIILDKSIPNCYNMYMKKRWNVAKELERIAERKRKWKQIDWMFLLKHPLTWILLMTLVAGLLGQ
jgi:hypothetical protein